MSLSVAYFSVRPRPPCTAAGSCDDQLLCDKPDLHMGWGPLSPRMPPQWERTWPRTGLLDALGSFAASCTVCHRAPGCPASHQPRRYEELQPRDVHPLPGDHLEQLPRVPTSSVPWSSPGSPRGHPRHSHPRVLPSSTITAAVCIASSLVGDKHSPCDICKLSRLAEQPQANVAVFPVRSGPGPWCSSSSLGLCPAAWVVPPPGSWMACCTSCPLSPWAALRIG